MKTPEQVTEILKPFYANARHCFANKIRELVKATGQPAPVEDLYDFFDRNAIITGGCIASIFHEQPIKDIDVFFCGGFKHLWPYPIKAEDFHFVAADCGKTPEEIVKAFDFEHCQFWFNGQELRGGPVESDCFFSRADAAFGNLILHYCPGAHRPGAALIRAGKMIERGWHLTKDDSQQIVTEIIGSFNEGTGINELVAFDDYVPTGKGF